MPVTFSNIITGEGVLSIGPLGGAVVDIGATQDGAEIAWEPDMVDIEIDQFGDAARVIVSKIKVSIKTKLAEATLENLAYSWNLETTGAGSELSTSVGVSRTLKMGIQSVYPVERRITLVGLAPGTSGTTTKTRTYTCNRVVQYSSSSHMLKRAENVAYPVDFRILPDPSATGQEYGTIVDQL
jgi:hypothetical protein